MKKLLAALCFTLLSGCMTLPVGTSVILGANGKPVAQIETVLVKPQDVPSASQLKNPVWWMQCGGSKSTWTAPLYNNGAPYLPNVQNQFERNLSWWLRNPACNFVGFVIGFEGQTYKVSGQSPVLATTLRDVGRQGWKFSLINGWAPFESYAGKHLEFYIGWRPSSGGFGAKFVWHQ
jgi:hypothetical protein